MTFSSVLEIIKIIAAVFGLLVLVTICIAFIAVIIVFSVTGLSGLVRERIRYVNADDLKKRLDNSCYEYSLESEYRSAIRRAKEIIDHMVNGD
ncbi:MAG: hypothetical protein HDR03_14910 [Lachnospiraceae bacterium]|nr:hypothetical protein [Lachnospiraceae bacterium]